MAVKIYCPRCGQEYQVENNVSGMTAQCVRCGADFQIPALPVAEPSPVFASPQPPPAALQPPAVSGPVKPVSMFDRFLIWLASFFLALLIVILLICAFVSFSSADAQDIQQQIHGALSAQIFLTLILILLGTAILIKIDSAGRSRR